MCFLNVNLEYDIHNDISMAISVQPIPILTLAVPLDIAQVGARLEAYSHLKKSTTTLRLCHRFCPGPLSKLPVELLDRVIDYMQRSEMTRLLRSWTEPLQCFQGRCRLRDHLEDGDVDW